MSGATSMLTAAVVGFSVQAAAFGGQLTYDEPAPGRDSGRIYYYVPDGLDLARTVPLLVFLHGGGDSTAGTYFSEERCALMPDVTNAPFIVAAPSAPVTGDSSRWNHAGTSKLIDATIAAASKKFPIDFDRKAAAEGWSAHNRREPWRKPVQGRDREREDIPHLSLCADGRCRQAFHG